MSEKKLVCHGAMCKCSFGDFPDTLVVSSQQKHYINDTKGSQKLMATDKELGAPFQAKTFGQCKMQPTGSSFKPCMPAITTWDGFFEKTQIQSNQGFPLLEDSKATCSFGGAPSVEITFHGQVAVPSAQNIANADPEVLSQIMPLIDVNEIDAPDPYDALQVADENSEFEEEHKAPRIIDFYYVRKDKNKDEKLTYGDELYVILESQEMIGEKVDLELHKKKIDFMYEGNRLKENTIKDYQIRANKDKILMSVIREDNEDLE